MKHTDTQTLDTKRLILRKFEISDADAMFQNWASDSEVTKYLTWPPHANVDVTRELLQDWVTSYQDDGVYHWAITLKEHSDEVIGDISVVEKNEQTMCATIGYCISHKLWHQGITTEALQRVIHYLFDVVGFNRIEARHDVNNPNSGKVMQKCGMQYEGTLRQNDINNQGICDVCSYAILKSDRR